jgi:hypothetical protein
MVLLSALDVMEKAGDDRVNHERLDRGWIDVLSLSLDHDDCPCIPGNGLTMAESMGAFKLRLIQVGPALSDEPMPREHFLRPLHE